VVPTQETAEAGSGWGTGDIDGKSLSFQGRGSGGKEGGHGKKKNLPTPCVFLAVRGRRHFSPGDRKNVNLESVGGGRREGEEGSS